jgi:cell wall-associated NlpC family hydrolase
MGNQEWEERQLVVGTAMTWLRTPYHLDAQIKGVGVDCGTLLTAVFAEAGLIEAVNLGHHKPDFHLHKGIEVYQQWLEKYCSKSPGPPQPGDIITYRFGRLQAAHAVLVINWPQVIHAQTGVGVVLTDITTDSIADRQTAVWSFWRNHDKFRPTV